MHDRCGTGGKDGNEISYTGRSVVIDPRGQRLAELQDEESILTMELSGEALDRFRKKFPAFLDGDDFDIKS